MDKARPGPIPGIRRAVLDATPYQPGQFAEDIRDTYNIEKVVKIASNENPYGPFPHSSAAMRAEIEQLNLYPDANFSQLRAALSRIHGVGAEYISISHGAEGMLQTIAKCFLQDGDEVIIPAPSYTLYAEISKIMGARIVSVPMVDYQTDPLAIAAALTPRTKLIWMANPNNPTGTIFDKNRLSELLAQLPPNARIVLDEAYAEFADTELLPDRIAMIRDGLPIIAVRTFSKAYGMAGARLGYAITQEEIVTVINTVSEPFNANRVALAGALGVLEKDGPVVAESIDRIRSERRRTEQRLQELDLGVIPSQANFIMFETPMDAERIFQQLLSQGIIVRPCSAWGLTRMLRVSVGTPQQMDQFIDTLATLLNRCS